MKYLIVGLGNIGSEYSETRHNIGFKILDAFAKASNLVFEHSKLAYTATAKHKGRTLILIKPTTYMNLSGKAVRYYMQQEKISINNVLVLVDDVAIPFGKIRLKPSGSSAGHNGLKNIEELLGSRAYPRLRFGIGDNYYKGKQIDYVLGEFDNEEQKDLDLHIDNSIEAIKSFVTIGMERTMNFFNKK
jgi:PTH1 family peptidyl-tRNA hydrolase